MRTSKKKRHSSLPEKTSAGAHFGAEVRRNIQIERRSFNHSAGVQRRTHIFFGRYVSADSANSTCLFELRIIFDDQQGFGTTCAIADLYPAALWFGKASVERRIHSLHEDDPIFCSIPQFSSSFCPRTSLTVQRAFLCAVPGMRSCMMDNTSVVSS